IRDFHVTGVQTCALPIFRKAFSAESVLIGDHHQFKVGFPGDTSKPGEHPWIEFQFFKAVNLFVGRLDDERAVAIYKKYFLHNSFRASISFWFSSGVPTVMRRLL